MHQFSRADFFKHIAIIIVLMTTLGCNVLSNANNSSFCTNWAKLDDDGRKKLVYEYAEAFANTLDRPPGQQLITCMQEKTDGFVKDKGSYYLCNSGEDFSAGRILGQAEATSLSICLQEIRKLDGGN